MARAAAGRAVAAVSRSGQFRLRRGELAQQLGRVAVARPLGEGGPLQIELGERRRGAGALMLGSAAPVERGRHLRGGDGVGAVGGRPGVIGAAADRARVAVGQSRGELGGHVLHPRVGQGEMLVGGAEVARCRGVATPARVLARLVGGGQRGPSLGLHGQLRATRLRRRD